jgi:hypothetical protein
MVVIKPFHALDATSAMPPPRCETAETGTLASLHNLRQQT